jgi:hypothetical protein
MVSWLSGRDDIFIPSVKEPHYFNFDHGNRTTLELSEYLKLYQSSDSRMIYNLDSSVWYLYSRVAVPNILKFCPEAKFVVIVRNQVEMAYSLHDQMIFSEFEDVKDFVQAWNLQEARAAGENIPSRCSEPSFLQYKEACSLGKQLARLYEYCPRERICLVFNDDMKVNPRGVYLEVLKFLGLPDNERDEFPSENVARKVRSVALRRGVELLGKVKRALRISPSFGLLDALVRLNSVRRERAPMPPALRMRLIDEFAADSELLRQLTGRDLSHQAPRKR